MFLLNFSHLKEQSESKQIEIIKFTVLEIEKIIKNEETIEEKKRSSLLYLFQQALQDPVNDIRYWAICGIRTLGAREEDLPHLLAALQDPVFRNRYYGLLALIPLSSQLTPSIPLLISMLSTEEGPGVEALCRIFRAIGQEGFPALTQAVDSEDLITRFNSVWVVSRLSRVPDFSSFLLPIVKRAAQDEDKKIRQIAIKALSLI